MKLLTFVVSAVFAVLFCFCTTDLTSAQTTSITSATTKSLQQGKRLTTQVHPNINYVECTDRNYVEIIYKGGTICFAGDGYQGLGEIGNLNRANYLHAGNNNGWIIRYDSSGKHQLYFYAYHQYTFDFSEITQIFINNQS